MIVKKKILFIQHASQFGGSAMSLLYTVLEVQRNSNENYEIYIALAKWSDSIAEFYRAHGILLVNFKEPIETYEHTTAVYYSTFSPLGLVKQLKQYNKIKTAVKTTERLLELVKPDIVHLNSVVLVGSAIAVKKRNIPLVWHVREHSVRGMFGIRRILLIQRLKDLPSKVIFICKADMQSWGNPENGTIVYNFVDFEKFDKNLKPPSDIEGIKIPTGDLRVLFLGALGRIKGGLQLVKAINQLMGKYPEKRIYMLFPGGIYDKPDYFLYKMISEILPLLGTGTYSQRIEKEIKKSAYPNRFIRFRFIKNVSLLFAAADVLVFPSLRPHFARPVIEAGAMAKPVIGSRLDGVNELIEEGKNGFFIKPGDEKDLMAKLEYFLNNKEEIKKLGNEGYKIAFEKYQAKNNITSIIQIYETLA